MSMGILQARTLEWISISFSNLRGGGTINLQHLPLWGEARPVLPGLLISPKKDKIWVKKKKKVIPPNFKILATNSNLNN